MWACFFAQGVMCDAIVLVSFCKGKKKSKVGKSFVAGISHFHCQDSYSASSLLHMVTELLSQNLTNYTKRGLHTFSEGVGDPSRM